MALLIPADDARVLAVTLDGRELARYYVAEHVDDTDILEGLGEVLVDGITRHVPDDLALDPGPLDEPASPAGAEPEPAAAPDAEPDTTRQTIASPQVTTTVPDPDEHPAPSLPSRNVASAAPEPAKDAWRPGAVKKGEAERGKATDPVVRRWAREEGLADPGARVQLPAWVRVEYERLRGGPPDFRARRVAREHGTPATTPDVDPGVASLQTIHVWCLRNGVEDRLPPSTDAKTAYRAAWLAGQQPEPPAAGTSAAGEDPPTPDERAGRPSGRASGRSNGARLPDFPSDSSSDDGTHYAGDGCEPPHPAIEPIGDGTEKKRSRARPEQLERARELAAESKTPVQICDLTGVSLEEARQAVADAKKDQKR